MNNRHSCWYWAWGISLLLHSLVLWPPIWDSEWSSLFQLQGQPLPAVSWPMPGPGSTPPLRVNWRWAEIGGGTVIAGKEKAVLPPSAAPLSLPPEIHSTGREVIETTSALSATHWRQLQWQLAKQVLLAFSTVQYGMPVVTEGQRWVLEVRGIPRSVGDRIVWDWQIGMVEGSHGPLGIWLEAIVRDKLSQVVMSEPEGMDALSWQITFVCSPSGQFIAQP